MVRKWYWCVLVGLLLLTADASAQLQLVGTAQTHAFVRVTSPQTGKWVVLGPDVLTFQQLMTIGTASIGELKLSKRDTIVLQEGKEVVFVGPVGIYAVLQWPVEAGEPLFLPVQITGTPDPDPKPDPGPEPQPDPTPVPPDKLFVLIVRESAKVTPAQGQIFTSKAIREHLLAKSYKLRVADPDELDADGQVPTDIGPYLERCQGKTLPQLFITSDQGALLYEGELPATEAATLALLKSKGGA